MNFYCNPIAIYWQQSKKDNSCTKKHLYIVNSCHLLYPAINVLRPGALSEEESVDSPAIEADITCYFNTSSYRYQKCVNKLGLSCAKLNSC